jgi:hypothetical protein
MQLKIYLMKEEKKKINTINRQRAESGEDDGEDE